ncbi:hypothetical protein ANN_08097 [Periplaneta americana]|uniref:Reverse transcriptase domain-containing protein n=1 Tax=Periplaneta americana TaxID=6978 RepID=A0ABQ8T1V2_PERAM|nr:hypothetical protein ANN_08097 [Periplaneta americana]
MEDGRNSIISFYCRHNIMVIVHHHNHHHHHHYHHNHHRNRHLIRNCSIVLIFLFFSGKHDILDDLVLLLLLYDDESDIAALQNYLNVIETWTTENKMKVNVSKSFRTGHSTSTGLLKVTEDIREALDEGQITILTLLDYFNAFDTVDVDLQIAKLRVLHFSDNALAWMDSYLRERQHVLPYVIDQNPSHDVPVRDEILDGYA